MGGSAFKEETHGFITSRMTQNQYTTLSNLILPLLRLYFRTVAVPPEALGKSTYGDLDVMVCKPLDLHPHDAILQLCSNALASRCKAFIYNPGTSNIAVTLDGMVFQVDVHVVEHDDIWAVDYWMHSWGDMGMIVSSVIKAWGLRLSSSRGLWIEVPEHGAFVLNLNMERIAEFLGLDWERYSYGFETMEDLFEWIEALKINGEKVGIKSKGKLKDKVHNNRPMWVAYWSRGEDVAYEPSSDEKHEAVQQAIEFFGKQEELETIQKEIALNKIAREKFNGNRVMEWTGANGKILGLLMKRLKGDERLSRSGLVRMEDEEIRSIVMEQWKAFLES